MDPKGDGSDQAGAWRARAATWSGSLWVQVPMALALHAVLWPRFFRLCQLPHDAYFAPVLARAAAERTDLLVFLGLDFGLLLLAWRQVAWRRIDPGGRTRWFVLAAAAILAWAFSTYDLNFYFDQAHLLDRLLLLALLALIAVHPSFVVPFLGLLLVIALQLHHPLPEGIWVWPDKRLPLDSLVLFNAFLLVRAAARRGAPHGFLFLVLCLTGATYAHAAVEKLRLGPWPWTWLLEEKISNLVVASYLNGGWLRGLGDDGIAALARGLAVLDRPIALATLLIELGGFALVCGRRATRLAIAGFVLMHAAILVSSGIFFWKWVLFDFALLGYYGRMEADARRATGAGEGQPWRWVLHSRALVVLALLVVAGTRFYFYNVDFAWFDSKVTNYFVLRATGESGARYRLPARFFSPYDMLFQQSRFYYLTRRPLLADTYGTTHDHALLRALEEAKPEDLDRLRGDHGLIYANRRSAQRFAVFLRRYVTGALARGDKFILLNRLAPPYHFQSGSFEDAFDFQEPLVAVDVELLEYFFDGRRIVPTGWDQVLTLKLATAAERQP